MDDATDGLVHFMVSKNAGNIFAGYTPIAVEEWRIDNDLQILSAVDVPGLDPQTVGGEIVTWGHAVITEPEPGGGYTYIFGAWKRNLDGYRLVVCRRSAILGSLPNNVPYFWDGATWSADMQDVADLGPTPGNSLSVIPHPGGGWLCTSCRKGLFDTVVAAWHADAPEGPWTDLGDIFDVPAEFDDQYNYGGLSYITSAGKLRIMYNLNGPGVQILADYRRYGVRWAEIDVPGRP